MYQTVTSVFPPTVTSTDNKRLNAHSAVKRFVRTWNAPTSKNKRLRTGRWEIGWRLSENSNFKFGTFILKYLNSSIVPFYKFECYFGSRAMSKSVVGNCFFISCGLSNCLLCCHTRVHDKYFYILIFVVVEVFVLFIVITF